LEHGPLNFDLDRLETLIFNPIEHLPSLIDNSLMSNLDPDLNISKLMPSTSKYLIENEIINLVREKSLYLGISILHINCRSLLANFDKFRTLNANLAQVISFLSLECLKRSLVMTRLTK
jgi:hypothetical protein